jgi:hypothetical protein
MDAPPAASPSAGICSSVLRPARHGDIRLRLRSRSTPSQPPGACGRSSSIEPALGVEALNNAGEVVAAVLGIAITVVAIIVELASNRYTHRITELFVSEPINFGVMGFFVITAVQCLVVNITFDVGSDGAVAFVLLVGAAVSMIMLGLSLMILLPYFAFVFSFLNRSRSSSASGAIPSRRSRRRGEAGRTRKHEEAVRGISSSRTSRSTRWSTRTGVSMASADALRQLLLDYQKIRPRLSDDFFKVEGDLAHNPDFVSMAPAVLETVTERRIWLEMKILRQYQTLYNEALNRMRDMNYLIAINTRQIAEKALEQGNAELFELTVKFFNTYLRATVNAKDVRTAYNVLNQYRLLAEHVLPTTRAAHDRAGALLQVLRRRLVHRGCRSSSRPSPTISAR